MRNYRDLYEALDDQRVGDEVTLHILRKGGVEEADVTVKLGERVFGQVE